MTQHHLLDPRVVAEAANARLVPGPVVKEPANPLFVENRPWEVRLDNLYANLVHDAAAGVCRCWYSPFIVDEAEKTTPPGRRAAVRYAPTVREMGVCYAESRDGLRWEKPALGLCEFEGSLRNNIVLRGPHGSGVFRDEHESDPSRRYKFFYARDDHVMEVAFSADGLRWTKPVSCRAIEAIGDTHNNALWAPALDRYVGFTRLWSKGAYQGVRVVGRTESPDFVHWTRAEPVLQGLDDAHQLYAMPVFRYGEGYLGLAMIFDTVEDRVRPELAWSPDTVRWERVAPGEPLIPNGPEGAWDWGCIYAAACPVFRDEGILLYYGGSDNVHTNWRKSAMGCARLRPDGFAGYRSDAGETGEVVTRPLTHPGGELHLNLDAPHGTVTVEARDAGGAVKATSARVNGDGAALRVHWASGSLAGQAGCPIRLRFRLRDAVLYSFSWQ